MAKKKSSEDNGNNIDKLFVNAENLCKKIMQMADEQANISKQTSALRDITKFLNIMTGSEIEKLLETTDKFCEQLIKTAQNEKSTTKQTSALRAVTQYLNTRRDSGKDDWGSAL